MKARTTLNRRVLWAGLCLGAGLLAPALPARAGGMAPDLQRKVNANPKSTTKVPVIVQFSVKGANSATIAKNYNGSVFRDQPLINASTMSVPLNAVAGLSNNPNVKWVSPNRSLAGQWDYDTQTMGVDQ